MRLLNLHSCEVYIHAAAELDRAIVRQGRQRDVSEAALRLAIDADSAVRSNPSGDDLAQLDDVVQLQLTAAGHADERPILSSLAATELLLARSRDDEIGSTIDVLVDLRPRPCRNDEAV